MEVFQDLHTFGGGPVMCDEAEEVDGYFIGEVGWLGVEEVMAWE